MNLRFIASFALHNCRRTNFESLRVLVLRTAVPVVAFTLLVTASFAQDKSPTKAPPAITLDGVKQLRKAASDSTTLKPDVRKQILAEYDKAISQLTEAGKLASQIKALKAELKQADSQFKALQKQLNDPTKPKPPATSNWSVEDLEAKAGEAETAAKTAREQFDKIEAEIKRRTDHRAKLADLQATARKEIAAVEAKLQKAPPSDEPAEMSQAKRAHLRSQKKFHETQLTLLDQEGKTYEETSRVWRLRKDLADRDAKEAQKREAYLKRKLGERRQKIAEDQAAAARKAAANALPAVKDAARRYKELAEQNATTVAKVEKTRKELEARKAELEELEQRFEDLRKRAEAANYSSAIGQLLRNQRLPDQHRIRERIRSRQDEIAKLNVRILDLESERKELLDVDAAVERSMKEVDDSLPKQKRENIKQELRQVHSSRLETITELIENTRRRLDRLVALDSIERNLADAIDRHKKFIAEHILWVRSTDPLGAAMFARIPGDMASLFALSHWQAVWETLETDIVSHPFWPIVLLIVLVWLLVRRHQFKERLRDLGQLAAKRNCTSLKPTLSAIGLTILLGAPIPFLLLWLGWRLTSQTFPDSFAYDLGTTLLAVALLTALLDLLGQSCRRHGLGPDHFGWNAPTALDVRGSVRGLHFVALPFASLVVLTEAWNDEQISGSVGRLAFLISMAVFAWAIFRLLRPSGAVMTYLKKHPDALITQTRKIWSTILIGAPVLMGLASAFGYHYTAVQLTMRMLTTFGLFAGLVGLRAILLRWLLVTHRQVAIQRHRERMAAQAQANEAAQQEGVELSNMADAMPEVGLMDIKQQTRDFIRIATGLAVVVGTYFIWIDVLPALSIVHKVRLWPNPTAGADDPNPWITLGHVLVGIFIAAVTILAAKNIPGLAEITVLKRLPMDAGARYAATTVTRYAIVVVGLALSVRQIGLGWSSIQWLVAAMGVGLGFGLQEIFANFVSGLILLFERPIRVGDTVTIGDVTGTVTRIRIRATTIVDWDNKELIVPNKQFVTGNLVNWTLSNSHLRLVIGVGVAYGSNTQLATELLYKVAKENPNVMAEPEPVVVFTQFADSTLNLELRVFVNSVATFRRLAHDINQAIDAAFKQADIEIAFPQRDLHLRSVSSDMLKIQVEAPDRKLEAAGMYHDD